MNDVQDAIAREVVVKAPIARVWELVTDSRHLARWYPGAQLVPQVGSTATFDCGAEAPYLGVVERVEPPRRLAWRWCLAAGVPVGQGPTTRVEITLSPAGDDTRVRLTESGLAALSPEDRARLQAGNDAGWVMLLDDLASQALVPAARQAVRGGIDTVFGALADPTRRTIMETVARDGGASASALARRLPIVISRQGIAKHLAILENAGLVDRKRRGREIRFHPRAERIAEAMDWMAGIAAEWDDRLATLARLAEQAPEAEPCAPAATTETQDRTSS